VQLESIQANGEFYKCFVKNPEFDGDAAGWYTGSMNRLAVSILVSAVSFFFTGCPDKPASPGTVDRRGTVVLRLAETMPAGHPSARASEYFASLVGGQSGGRIRIKVYYGGQLGTPQEILEQVQFGGIALARINSLELTETVPSLQYYFNPLHYEGPDGLMQWASAGWKKITDDCQMERLVPLSLFYPDIRCFYSDGIGLAGRERLAGRKIGTDSSVLMTQAITRLGAVPVDMVSADTYKSLRSGYMEARETGLSEFVISDDYPFINHILLSRHISCPDALVASSRSFTSFSAADRNLLLDCAAQAALYQKELMDTLHASWFASVRGKKNISCEDGVLSPELQRLVSPEGAR